MSDIKLEASWPIVVCGVKKMLRLIENHPDETPFDSQMYMELYSAIYYLAHKNLLHYPKQIYKHYKQALVDYINMTVLPALNEIHDEYWLMVLVHKWSNYKVLMRWLTCSLACIERLEIRSLPPFRDTGLFVFFDLVYNQICVRAKDVVLALINVERLGGQVDRTLLKNVIGIFVEIGTGFMFEYVDDFEAYFLDDTTTYYSREASRWILQDSCPEYMLKSEECLKKEKNRVFDYLHVCSEEKLLKRVRNELLLAYENQLLEKENSGFRVLLKDDKVEDLSRMFKLYSEVPKGLDPIGTLFKQHICDEGIALIQQAQDAAICKSENSTADCSHEEVLVRKAVLLHDRFMAFVIDCFASHAIFLKSLKEAFDIFLNKTVAGCSTAELLASYCDIITKKGGSEKLSNEAVEESLDKVVMLLDYVMDKDMFVELYRKNLCRRLLFDKNGNVEHDKHFLAKLKQQYGAHFTSKMEGMVSDFKKASVIQIHFEEYLQHNPNAHPGLDLNVTVVTTGYWPSYKTSDFNLPTEMIRCVESFEKFYKIIKANRTLSWIHSFGSCHLTATFGQKTMDLVLGTYQAAALLLFNTADCLSYSEIATLLNLPNEFLVRVLQSLSCDKYKILIKKPYSKTVSQTDSFLFNSKFTDRMRRIKIPLPPMDEVKKIVEDVDKDRRFAIDAIIVRIMKSRKVLGYQELVAECVEQQAHSFKLDFKQIKKRLENLIARDYIERDTDDPHLFRYIA
ncbi:unnamed protein product [Amaranthus hypochondriacus]